MANIQTIEPEFDPDYINEGGIAEVIDELRQKINELINAHNAGGGGGGRGPAGPRGPRGPAGPHRPGGFPTGGCRKTRRKRGRTRRRTRRRRKRRRRTRRKRRQRRTRRGGELFGFRRWVKKKTGYTARKEAREAREKRDEETEQALARLEGDANNRGVINNR